MYDVWQVFLKEVPPLVRPWLLGHWYWLLSSLLAGKYFGLDDDAYERQITDDCLTRSAHQLPEDGTYQSQTMYTPYTVKMGQLTLYRYSLVSVCPLNYTVSQKNCANFGLARTSSCVNRFWFLVDDMLRSLDVIYRIAISCMSTLNS